MVLGADSCLVFDTAVNDDAGLDAIIDCLDRNSAGCKSAVPSKTALIGTMSGFVFSLPDILCLLAHKHWTILYTNG